MAGLPKAYIKKYGVSKAAWKAYRASKGTYSKSRTRGGSGKMAKKKRFGGKSGGKLFGLGTKGLIAGLGIAGVAAGALFGDQIASMVQQKTGIQVPFGGYAAAFVLGGPAGVAGKFAKDALMPSGATGGNTNGAW